MQVESLYQFEQIAQGDFDKLEEEEFNVFRPGNDNLNSLKNTMFDVPVTQGNYDLDNEDQEEDEEDETEEDETEEEETEEDEVLRISEKIKAYSKKADIIEVISELEDKTQRNPVLAKLDIKIDIGSDIRLLEAKKDLLTSINDKKSVKSFLKDILMSVVSFVTGSMNLNNGFKRFILSAFGNSFDRVAVLATSIVVDLLNNLGPYKDLVIMCLSLLSPFVKCLEQGTFSNNNGTDDQFDVDAAYENQSTEE